MIGMSFPDSQAASVPLASHPGLLAGPSIPFGPEFASFILFLRFSRSLVALLESASESGCWAILNTTEGIKILSCRWRKDEFGGGGGGSRGWQVGEELWHGPHAGISTDACYIYTPTGYIYLSATTFKICWVWSDIARGEEGISERNGSIATEIFTVHSRPPWNHVNW